MEASGARSTTSTSGSSRSRCSGASRRTSARTATVDVADELLARARLGGRVAPSRARQEPDRANPRGDRQPPRRLHRPPHGTQAELARAGADVDVEQVVDAGGGDGDGDRDQQPARSARHARRPRQARRRGRCARPGDDDAHSITALGYRELGIGAGAPRVADEGSGAQHAARGARSRSCGGDDLRDDGAAALEWAAAYLERVRRAPVLSRVEPGCDPRGSCPPSPPSTEPFAAVLRDLDEVVMPGLTHWQSPRYFAYFASTRRSRHPRRAAGRHAEPGRDPLARRRRRSQELEGVDLDWVADLLGLPDGCTGTSRTRRRRRRSPRSPPRGGSPGQAGRRAAPSTRTPRSTKAARMLGLELRTAPVDERYAMRADALDLDGACAVVATVGTTSYRLGRPGARRSPTRAPTAGAWLHVDAAYAGSAVVCPELPLGASPAGERADSLVVNPHKWLLTPMDCSRVLDEPAGGAPRRVQPRPRVPADSRRGRQPERVRHRRSAAGSARSSSGRCSAATGARGCRR